MTILDSALLVAGLLAAYGAWRMYYQRAVVGPSRRVWDAYCTELEAHSISWSSGQNEECWPKTESKQLAVKIASVLHAQGRDYTELEAILEKAPQINGESSVCVGGQMSGSDPAWNNIDYVWSFPDPGYLREQLSRLRDARP